MFYIVPSGDELNTVQHPGYHSLGAAVQYAERSHKINGKHYRIVEIRNVWNTWMEKNKTFERIMG